MSENALQDALEGSLTDLRDIPKDQVQNAIKQARNEENAARIEKLAKRVREILGR